MNLAQVTPAKLGRFSSMIEGDNPRPVYDTIIDEVMDCVLAPTLGSILPFWLLAIPRVPTVNFLHWSKITGHSPSEMVAAFLCKHEIASTRVIWFEHGPMELGSPLGCGVDQAHIHIIIDSPFCLAELVGLAVDRSNVTWAEHRDDPYSVIDSHSSYIVLGSSTESFVARNVEVLGSQFIRRVIAELLGTPNDWDYKTNPFVQNAYRTVQSFIPVNRQ